MVACAHSCQGHLHAHDGKLDQAQEICALMQPAKPAGENIPDSHGRPRPANFHPDLQHHLPIRLRLCLIRHCKSCPSFMQHVSQVPCACVGTLSVLAFMIVSACQCFHLQPLAMLTTTRLPTKAGASVWCSRLTCGRHGPAASKSTAVLTALKLHCLCSRCTEAARVVLHLFCLFAARFVRRGCHAPTLWLSHVTL